jgi:hypothetical protein
MPRGAWLLVVAALLSVAPLAHAEGDPSEPAPAKDQPQPKAAAKPAGAQPTKKKAAKPAGNERVPSARRRGAIVVAKSEAARIHAKALARLIYQDAALRPDIDEKMAKALLGDDPDESTPADQREGDAAVRADVLATVRALDAADESVRRRLLASTASDLHAELVVLVVVAGDGPTAKVLKAANGRYAAVTLAPQRVTPKEEGRAPGWDWADAVPIVKSLRQGPPPGPRAPVPIPGPGSASAADQEPAGDGEEDGDLLTSPWFWSGLGIVVTVGVTVLVLSQTAFKNSDVVNLQGKVSP